MDAITAIKTAAKTASVPTTHIGPKLGKARTYLATMASKNSMPQVDTMAAMADVCGYALALVPRGSLPGDAIVIDAPNAE